MISLPLFHCSTVIFPQENIYPGKYCAVQPEIRSTVFFLAVFRLQDLIGALLYISKINR